MVPTSVAVATVSLAILLLEWIFKTANYRLALDFFWFALGLFVIMTPAFVVSALWGKPLCKADETGVYHKGELIKWTDMESIDYIYGYTRYHGDHSVIKIRACGKTHVLRRGPIWFPLYARRYTKEFTTSIPHLKKHLLKGFIIGVCLSAIVAAIYIL